jgi:hypothetical protein
MQNLNSIAEQNLIDALLASQKTLGETVPILVTETPQVPMNAIKHQLTGQNTYMPAPELAFYLHIGMQMIAELEPHGVLETQMAQRIIDANWRINRAIALENNVYQQGVAEASVTLRAENPFMNESMLLVQAQVQSFHKNCNAVFDKFSRYSARLERSLRIMTRDLEAKQEARIAKRGDLYNLATCPAYAWYKTMVGLTEKVLEKVTPPPVAEIPATIEEETISDGDLFRQIIETDLPEATRLLRDAHARGDVSDQDLAALGLEPLNQPFPLAHAA